jgi:hypothetical protein
MSLFLFLDKRTLLSRLEEDDTFLYVHIVVPLKELYLPVVPQSCSFSGFMKKFSSKYTLI